MSANSTQQQALALLQHLPQKARHILGIAQNQLGRGTLYLVGGTVRDLILGKSVRDYDVVLENANTRGFAKKLQETLGGELTCHDDFGTCTLELKDVTLDLATARDETYAYPGALPKVWQSTITKDLARRDFSINALAIRLNAIDLLDPFNGRSDLSTKQLRILHPHSFIDDPTRILRGARLAGRLDFHWEAQTRAAIDDALETATLKNVSRARLKQELELTLSEPRVTPALTILGECNALSKLLGLATDETASLTTLRQTVTLLRSYRLTLFEMTAHLDTLRQRSVVPSESYLLALLLTLPDSAVTSWLQTFNYSQRFLTSLQRLQEIRRTNELSSQHFAKLSEAEKTAARAFSDSLDKRIQDLTLQFRERRLTGQDVLDLGLEPGPAVGSVLARVAKARDAGEVHTFNDELALANQLVQVMEKQ